MNPSKLRPKFLDAEASHRAVTRLGTSAALETLVLGNNNITP